MIVHLKYNRTFFKNTNEYQNDIIVKDITFNDDIPIDILECINKNGHYAEGKGKRDYYDFYYKTDIPFRHWKIYRNAFFNEVEIKDFNRRLVKSTLPYIREYKLNMLLKKM